MSEKEAIANQKVYANGVSNKEAGKAWQKPAPAPPTRTVGARPLQKGPSEPLFKKSEIEKQSVEQRGYKQPQYRYAMPTESNARAAVHGAGLRMHGERQPPTAQRSMSNNASAGGRGRDLGGAKRKSNKKSSTASSGGLVMGRR